LYSEAAIKETDLTQVAQFAVAALYERWNRLNLKPAVVDGRYSKLI
jgi:hypothetical protein